MNIPYTNRPGVYSQYSVSSLYTRPKTNRNLALIMKSAIATPEDITYISSYSEALSLFKSNDILALGSVKILLQSGINKVCFIPLLEGATTLDYTNAFKLTEQLEDIGAVVSDSSEVDILKALNQSVLASCASLKERFAVSGAAATDVALGAAEAINSERLLMCCPSSELPEYAISSPLFTASAIAGMLLSSRDPAKSFNGEVLSSISKVTTALTEEEIESLLVGGVTPIEGVNSQVECIKAITTRTKTDGTEDMSFSSINTVLIIDDVIKTIRTSLKNRLKGLKNTVQTRESIMSQVTVELSAKVDAEIIESFSPPLVYPSKSDPTVCVVEISFNVAHVVNQIFISANIKI